MLEAAGGGAGTDWWGMPMEQIQQLAQSPDIDAHYQIVDGWQKSYELVADHMAQVTLYRDSLAAAWPPEKSSAAQAYVDRLNVLIGYLQETQDAALSNHDALSSATLSLSLAKTEMGKIYSQWDANNKALLAFNQQKSQAQSGKPTPSPSPSGDEPPPVTADQQEALRQKAAILMSGVSSDLAQAQLKVVQPKLYDPSDFVSHNGDPGETPVNKAPVLPPIVPTSFASSGSGSGTGSSPSPHGTSAFPTTPHNTPPAAGPSFNGGSGMNQPGLVLGGTNPPSTLPPPPTTLPNPVTVPPSTGLGPITGPGLVPPTTAPFLPDGTLPSGIGKVPSGEGGFKAFGGGAIPEGGPRAMPPGGIIGRAPGGAALGEPGESRIGPQRVNPVGGVIGEPNAAGGMIGGGRGAATRQGGASTLNQQPYGQAAGSRRGGRRDQADKQWDPDNPWATAEGVEPIVIPAIERRIDPGPAIGLG